MNKSVQYAKAVVFNEIVAPSQVKQACINFLYEYYWLQDQDDYEYKWNDKIEHKIDKIIKQLNFARGAKSAQPMYENLALFQWFLIQNIFCWVYKEFPLKRKIRNVVFTVARKNAKSVIACIVHILCFFLDEENQTAYIGSNTKQQATIIFDELVAIIKSSPNMQPFFNVKKTYVEFIPKSAKIIALSGDAQKADGTMVYHCSVDELGASNEISKMVSSLETGQFGPRNPLILKISTSYPIVNEYNYWQEVVKEMIKNTNESNKNPRLFGLAYLIDNPFDEIQLNGKKAQRWEDRTTWLEANPLVAEIPDLNEKLHEDYETKKTIPQDLHLFKTKNLNIWQSEALADDSRFIDSETIKKYEDRSLNDWSWWRGKQVFIGIDLSHSGRDNSAVTFAYHDYENRKTYIKNVVFYPKQREDEKSSTEGVPYRKWSKMGWCAPMGEETVDYEGIGRFVEQIVNDYQLQVAVILYDDKYSHDLLQYLNKNVKTQMPSTKVQQNAKTLGPAVSALQKELYDGNVRYASNKLFVSACTNGTIETRTGKPYVRKPKSGEKYKIDSLVATFNAYTGIMVYISKNKFKATKKIFGVG